MLDLGDLDRSPSRETQQLRGCDGVSLGPDGRGNEAEFDARGVGECPVQEVDGDDEQGGDT